MFKPFPSPKIILPKIIGAVFVLCLLSGCKLPGLPRLHHVASAAPPAAVVKAAPPPLHMMPLDLTKVQPNEMGDIPILEYHDLVNTGKAKGYQYPAAAFRRDMNWLYDHHYRPVSLSDMVNGTIDCPAGTSPVVLTFDDALAGQFRYLDGGRIDPNCAVGILDDLHARHPDWATKGTFFILTNGDPKLPPSFYQSGSEQGKLEYLVKEGYQIGNHTIHHRAGIRHWADAQVMAEFAGAVANIHALLPGYPVQTLALPFGVYPKNQKLVVQGASGGVSYRNICALLAGAGPVPSPVSKRFKPYRLERIIPGDEAFAFHFWMNKMEASKALKFVSDGDPNTFTVPAPQKEGVNMARLQKSHQFLRVYSGTQLVAQQP